MRGSVRKRGETWTWYLWVPDALSGKPRQRSKGGFRTKKECQDALNDALADLRKGTFVEPSRRTIASFLTDEWLPAVAAQGRRPGTVANYRIHVTAHIIPALGGIELQQLSPAHLNSFYRALLSEGRRNGRPMAQKTVRNVHNILHRALQDALRWGLVARNVASAANPPAGKSPERAVWTPDRAANLHRARPQRPPVRRLDAVRHHRHAAQRSRWAAGRTSTSTWPRRVSPRLPRVLVDHHGRRLRAQEPRRPTVAGARPGDRRGAAWRTGRQQAEQKTIVGARYLDSGLVFTWPDGSPIHPQRFSPGSSSTRRAAGLPRIRLHDLRHSYATAALAAGVPAQGDQRAARARHDRDHDGHLLARHPGAGRAGRRHGRPPDPRGRWRGQDADRPLTNRWQPARGPMRWGGGEARSPCSGGVSEGGLEPPRPMRALGPQPSASAYSATPTWCTWVRADCSKGLVGRTGQAGRLTVARSRVPQGVRLKPWGPGVRTAAWCSVRRGVAGRSARVAASVCW